MVLRDLWNIARGPDMLGSFQKGQEREALGAPCCSYQESFKSRHSLHFREVKSHISIRLSRLQSDMSLLSHWDPSIEANKQEDKGFLNSVFVCIRGGD